MTTGKGPRTHRLPLRAGVTPSIGGHSEALQVHLSPVGDPSIEMRLGPERLVPGKPPLQLNTPCGPVDVLHTRGQQFKGTAGSVQGGRILFLKSNGSNLDDAMKGIVIAALNWTKVSGEVFVSNICVHPDFRRRGLGCALIEQAIKAFPKIKADGNMTIEGAHFMGHLEPSPSSAGHSAVMGPSDRVRQAESAEKARFVAAEDRSRSPLVPILLKPRTP